MDPDFSYSVQQTFAYGMTCFLVLALLFCAISERPRLLRAYDKSLSEKLLDPAFRARWRRAIDSILVVCAVLVMASYFLRGAPGGRFFHHWDVFHTSMGAKYHDELGYFDLYNCSVAIDRKDKGYFQSVTELRDLRTRNYISATELSVDDCEARFSPERLKEFKADLSRFGEKMTAPNWQQLFRDKGFNGTPFYTVVAGSLVSLTDGSIPQLTLLTLIDPLLMIAAFGAVAWGFGLRHAALLSIFFCTFFPNRFVHMGGSILRFDYIAALLLGMSALKREKWGVCAALFAWATMVRVFPAIFAVGLAIKIASDCIQHRTISRNHIVFAATYTGTMLLLFLVSLIFLEGPLDDYLAWAENMKVHNQKSASFRVGFRHLFMIRGSLEKANYGSMQRVFEQRWVGYALCCTLILLPILLAVRRLDKVSFTAIFGTVAFFLFATSTRYYYATFALLFLVDREFLRNRTLLLTALTVFAASAFDFFYFSINGNTTLMYNFILGAQLLLVVLILVIGLLFDPGLSDAPGRKIRSSLRPAARDLSKGSSVDVTSMLIRVSK